MEHYESDYHEELHKNFINNSEYYDARARIAFGKYFKGVKKDSKILEFGCGMGQNIIFFPNAVGYDVSEFALDFCKKKDLRVVDSLDKIEDNSIEVIFMIHVLEHLENPFEVLKGLKKKLNSDGKLIIVIPVQKMDKPSLKPDSNQHLYCWTFTTINNLLFRAGFKPIKNDYLIWNAGCKMLLPLNKISFKLYDFSTKLLSILIKKSFEMRIVGVKNEQG